jgi:hypothetical protein
MSLKIKKRPTHEKLMDRSCEPQDWEIDAPPSKLGGMVLHLNPWALRGPRRLSGGIGHGAELVEVFKIIFLPTPTL